jgi:hypothetical protein
MIYIVRRRAWMVTSCSPLPSTASAVLSKRPSTMFVPSRSVLPIASRFSPDVLILLSAAVSILLFLSIRFVLSRFARPSSKASLIQPSSAIVSWGLFTLESIPRNLPVTLTVPPPTTAIGKGVGVSPQSVRSTSTAPQMAQMQHCRFFVSSCVLSAYRSPVPSPYDSTTPISMAKMIMSRHVCSLLGEELQFTDFLCADIPQASTTTCTTHACHSCDGSAGDGVARMGWRYRC